MKDQLLFRLWQYQKERFPLSILLFTTLATVGSSWSLSSAPLAKALFLFFITLLYMFHLRGFDEVKDYEHDSRHYPDRPIQRNLVTLAELKFLTWSAIILELVLNLGFNTLNGIGWYLIALTYSLLTRKEFFARSWLRDHFFLYNFLHYIQLGIFQIYVYATLAPLQQTTSVVVWHWLLVLLLVLLMEFARKMRSKEADHANDTYSAKLGAKWVSVTYTFIFLTGLFLTSQVLQGLQVSLIFLLLPISISVTALLFAFSYAFNQNRKNSSAIQACAFFFYLFCHLSIILGANL